MGNEKPGQVQRAAEELVARLQDPRARKELLAHYHPSKPEDVDVFHYAFFIEAMPATFARVWMEDIKAHAQNMSAGKTRLYVQKAYDVVRAAEKIIGTSADAGSLEKQVMSNPGGSTDIVVLRRGSVVLPIGPDQDLTKDLGFGENERFRLPRLLTNIPGDTKPFYSLETVRDCADYLAR